MGMAMLQSTFGGLAEVARDNNGWVTWNLALAIVPAAARGGAVRLAAVPPRVHLVGGRRRLRAVPAERAVRRDRPRAPAGRRPRGPLRRRRAGRRAPDVRRVRVRRLPRLRRVPRPAARRGAAAAARPRRAVVRARRPRALLDRHRARTDRPAEQLGRRHRRRSAPWSGRSPRSRGGAHRSPSCASSWRSPSPTRSSTPSHRDLRCRSGSAIWVAWVELRSLAVRSVGPAA